MVTKLAVQRDSIQRDSTHQVHAVAFDFYHFLVPGLLICRFAQVHVLELDANERVQLNACTNLEGSICVIYRADKWLKVITKVIISLTHIPKQIAINLIIRSLYTRYHQTGDQYRQQCFTHHAFAPKTP